MYAIEASFNSTVRTILVLLVVWWLLRFLIRSRVKASSAPTGTPTRAKGDVRIERVDGKADRTSDRGIIDAEYEEIQ